DLDRKIMRYIRSYNQSATPIKWSYKNVSNRIKTTSETNDTLHKAGTIVHMFPTVATLVTFKRTMRMAAFTRKQS
ncbi:MAG: hypothetical protein QOI53_3887, partial [Verrucomicrobiota bacterium]|nr:hypothetical protein [Verrucomicrobiota bacterium]